MLQEDAIRDRSSITKILLMLYLFVVGVIAVNIHLKMLEAGVPYPGWEPPLWYPLLKFFVQLVGMAWLHQILKAKFPQFGYWRNTLVLFALMVTLMELVLRLPMTAGYVNGQAFLFTWLVMYLPSTIILFLAAAIVVLLSSANVKGISRRVVMSLGLLATAILVWKISEPLTEQLVEFGVRFVGPPNPEDILEFPYGQTVNLIASVTFIEPTLSCFLIGWLSWNSFSSGNIIRVLQFNLLVLMLVNKLVDQTVFMAYAQVPLKESFLSMGQFTFEWVFLGVMISLAMFFLKRTGRR
jgi:hypothetical protein